MLKIEYRQSLRKTEKIYFKQFKGIYFNIFIMLKVGDL